MYTGVHVYNDAKFAHSTMQLASLLGWLQPGGEATVGQQSKYWS